MLISKKSEIIEDFHGTKVKDPYRWLEDTNSDDTLGWVADRAKECKDYFTDVEVQSKDQERLTELWNFPKHYVPKQVEEKLFFQRNDGLQNQAVLYMKCNGIEKVILDPNHLSDDGTIAMTNFSVCSKGKYVAYSTAENGSDWQEIRVRDVESGKELIDVIKWVKFTSVVWSPDGKGFYYSRFPQPGANGHEEEGTHNKVYFHQLSTSQKDDILVHEQPDEKELMFSPVLSEDHQYIGLHVFYGTASENRFYYKPIDKNESFTKLLDQQDAEYTYITNKGSFFYFKTDLDAPKGRVIAIDVNSPDKVNWKEIIPEQDAVMEDIKYVKGNFVIVFSQDAHHAIQLYDENGIYNQEIELPFIGSLTELTVNSEQAAIYFGLTSFINPTAVFHFNLEKMELSLVAESTLPFEQEHYETTQVFYPSKDGTNIPMFLTHKKGLDLNGLNPVILYGYGGFNVSITPTFNPAVLAWLEKGGVYAVANLRGGMEYGEKWHKAGMLENKQNVFDDFIAAGEWLIENKYTSTERLAIMGGSNGGLLVAACMVQRPDLFGAVICRVPVIDMLRYHKFTIGKYWIPEYGNAENPEQFPFLYAYSPLHNIQQGIKYPPILIATADSDNRVVPAHAKKFTATLKEKADPATTVILRLEKKAGHGLGKPTSKLIDEWVDFYSFLDKEMNSK
ncbi:prolyl oligopeptidase family serine peptidase [Sutcliffiella rhizosphaerae]|uniref:prolyl oligopeptidase n=1 Tax=Sutcliffiella rhizosphaerae TaxID=2880967 RepID=A0ABN8AEM8_9BACI|nr:prolyl oligopeptidase family serine peptidase [Sutcliffiella rhizosphaerae]CAG9622684.1 Prolyl endopeptidase [Sutcliffiella rhizosphaerae]